MFKMVAGLGVLVVSMALFASPASGYERPERKPAIVLAAFGTTDVEAVESIHTIRDRIEKAFPDYEIHLAFTSNIIRNIWHKRAADPEFRRDHPNIPEEVYSTKRVLTTLATIQENGARLVLVQSLHVTDGEEYDDLVNLVKALEGYKTRKRVLHPFPWIGVGDPALGLNDGTEKCLRRAADALAPLANEANAKNASLVLMGHGNEHLNQTVFAKLQTILRDRFGKHVHIGTVEAAPFAQDIADEMKKDADAPKTVLLAPLMVVAGDHAKNDMAGDEDDSWVSIFRENGFTPVTHLVGLGSNNSWADIYVEHLKDLEKTVVARKTAEEAK